MSNTRSDHLFRLIKALSKPEKRYFKIYTSRHTVGDANKYHLLFDAIENLSEYNEEKIFKKFKGQAFLNQFSITKARLYEIILKSLDAFHSTSSIDATLRHDIHCIEILYKKTLYAQCNRLLQSAKKKAMRFEKHAVVTELLNWEKKLVEKDNYTEISEDDINRMHDDGQLYLDKIKNHNDFWYIKSRLFYLLNKRGKARSQHELSDFKSIIDTTLLQSEDKALYYETKYLYNHIYSAYYFGIGDYENSYLHLVRNVDYIARNIDLFADEPNVYFSILTNVIYVGIRLKKYKEAFSYLEKLQVLPETLQVRGNEDLDMKLFSSTYSIELTIYLLTGDFDKGIALAPIIEEGLGLYAGKINNVRSAYLTYNMAALFFSSGKYSEALHWVNRLLNDVDIDKSQDIYCYGQLLNLLIHMELGNQRLLPYAYRSTYRYLQSRNRVYRFETMILHFIGRIMKATGRTDEKTAWQQFATEIQTLENDEFEKTAFEYFDFISWAGSKLSGHSFRDIVKEKAGI